VHSFEVYKPIKDKEIIDKFDAINNERKDTRSLKEVLAHLSGSSGWNPEDLDVLDKATEDEYYDFFKSLDGSGLTAIIATSLKFARISNADAQMNSVTDKVKGALVKIGEESTLNKMRMEKFNI